MAMFLVDTNVMLAASAISELSNVATRAMPREIELRELVYDWLLNFDLSDDRIVEILKETGIDIARRTVAKYREALRIPSSVERRRMMKTG